MKERTQLFKQQDMHVKQPKWLISMLLSQVNL